MAVIDAPKVMNVPNIGKMPRAYMSSDFEVVRRVRLQYNNAWQAKEWEFTQILECWKMYFGAMGEQWDDDARRYKTERHMRVAQYNLIREKVRTMVGMLASDEYDGRYDPVDGVRNSGVEALENAYYCDKELMNYDEEYWQVILDGACHVGYMGIKIDDTKNWQGNIAFVRDPVWAWITDPAWLSNNIYHCMVAWKQGHASAQQILAMNPEMEDNEKVRTAIKREKELGRNWTRPAIENYDSAFPTFIDSYHVVEEHWVEEINKKRIIARVMQDDGPHWIPFPVTNDNELLERFAQANGVTDWQDGAQVVPYKDRILHLDRICPDLSPTKPIASGKPEIQIKCVPVYPFTFDKDIAGRNMGMVNDIIDPQKDLNYSKSKRQELLASAQGGAPVYNKQMMPDETDQKEFESNHNDPTRAWGVDGDPRTFMTRVADKQYPSELVRESEEPFQIIDRISGVSAAASARTQSSNEPASLFSMKLQVQKMGTLPLDKRIKMMRTWQYQSYFFQAQISYANDERMFTSRDGTRSTILNERLPDGSILNKVDEIPLCSVTISETEGSLNRQLRDRAEIAAMLQAIPKEYGEPIAIMIGQAFKTMNLSEDKKAAVEQAMAIEIAKARINSVTQIAQSMAAKEGAKAQGLQAEIMGVQLEQQLRQILSPAMPAMQPQGQALPQMISRPNQPMPQQVQPGPLPVQQQTMQPTNQ